MGNIGFTAIRDLGLALKDKLNITTFIETGTYKAQTTLWAAERFDKVVTIEAHKPYFEAAKSKLKGRKNVRLIYGDSRSKLRGVVSKLRKPALIWLDAHWCGNYAQSRDIKDECPLIEELKILGDYQTRHVILIDDARYFIEPPPQPHDPEQWPSLDEIRALLPDDYEIILWNDVIIAAPPEAVGTVKRFAHPSELMVVVLTSNQYVHCLPAFAYLFNKFWDAGQPVKVVRYDVRPAKLSGNFTNFAVGNQDDYSWSGGLRKYLLHHNSDLILLMLEDYFISKPVNTPLIHQLYARMQQQPEIAKIDLSDDRLKVKHSDYDDKLIRSDEDTVFQTSLQAAIWRKDYLERFLERDESAWQFEKRGTRRVIKARQNGAFDGIILGCKEPPLSYINAKGGEGQNPHLWDFKKFPEWMVRELREKGLLNG